MYYVYAWYNIDTDEIFYIGSGTLRRAVNLYSRNRKFKEYYKNHNCDVKILTLGLSKEESLQKEAELVIEYKKNGQCKCNLTTNGWNGVDYGENNPNYRNGQALKRRYELNPELKERTKHSGHNNGMSRKIEVYDIENRFVGKFDCISYFAQYLIDNCWATGQIYSIVGYLQTKEKQNKLCYGNFYIKYC